MNAIPTVGEKKSTFEMPSETISTTYMNVNYDPSEVRIEGLETLDYLDNLCQRERFTEQGDALTFESEVNSGLSLSASI